MTVEVVRSSTEAEGLSTQWSELADRAGGRHYTQPFWCLTWWRRLGQGDLHVVVVRSGGDLVGLAPLYCRRLAGVDRLKFLGTGLVPVSELLVAPGHEAGAGEMWDTLLSRPRTVLELHGYRHGGAGVSELRRSHGRSWTINLSAACPTIAIHGTLADYLKARPSSLRRKLRRSAQLRDHEDINVGVRVFTGAEDVTIRLAELTAIFDAAEAANPRLHFLAGHYREFTIDMLRAAALDARLALFVLYVGDRPAASAFALRSGTTLSYSAPRFDPRVSAYSPGHLVLRAIVEHAFTTGVTQVDLLIGDAAYKREWSDDSYDLMTVYAASSPGLLALRRLGDVGSTFACALGNAMPRRRR